MVLYTWGDRQASVSSHPNTAGSCKENMDFQLAVTSVRTSESFKHKPKNYNWQLIKCHVRPQKAKGSTQPQPTLNSSRLAAWALHSSHLRVRVNTDPALSNVQLKGKKNLEP